MQSLNQLIILGGGTAGWMAAAALSHHLQGSPVRIQLVESSAVGTVGVGEATLPGLRNFNASLGIDERAFIRATNATFKLGIRFEGWAGQSSDIFHPFSDYGAPIAGTPFHQWFYRARALGLDVGALHEYSFSAMLADQQRFAQPHADPGNPLADYKYAFHFDATAYAAFLRRYAEARGVERVDDRLTSVVKDPENGHLQALRLESGLELAGDFFIDCSGFRSLLLGDALSVPFEDWSHWLPVDGAYAVAAEPAPELRPYTRAIARDGGWQWQIPLQHRTGNGYVFASRFMDESRVVEDLMAGLEGAATGSPNRLRFTTGRRQKFWEKNCVALGLASGFLEPLESTSIALIQTGLSRLLMFLPLAGINAAEVEEANRTAQIEMERIRDFLILHYCRNGRQGPLWEYCRNMPLPDSLSQKIALFESRGHLQQRELESFEPASWLTFYEGFGVAPCQLDPAVLNASADDIARALASMRGQIASAANQPLSHAAFIARHCAA